MLIGVPALEERRVFRVEDARWFVTSNISRSRGSLKLCLLQRCNAARPFCIQCYNKGKPDDCEYPGDIQGLTRTQMLEENIALLEARIRELENPAEDTIQLLPAPVQLPTLSSPHSSGEIFDRVPASQSSVDFSPPTGIGNTAAADPAAQDVRAL